MIIEKNEVQMAGEYDIIIVGSGVSGIAAAISASRNGSKVLLIEKSTMIGGLATSGLISWFEPLCDGKGNMLLQGMTREILSEVIKVSFDTLPNEWQDLNKKECNTTKRCTSFFSPTLMTLVLNNMLEKAKVDLLLDTQVVKPIMEKNICKGVIVEMIEGRRYFKASFIIDTSGSLQIMHNAGIPCEDGTNWMSVVAYYSDFKTLKKSIDKNNIIFSRKWVHPGANLFGQNHPKNMPKLKGTTAKDITDYVTKGWNMLFDEIKKSKKETRDYTVLPNMPQLRTIRRLIGNYTITENDESKVQKDKIAICGDFFNSGKIYEIPFNSLWNKQFPNMLTAGRTISSSGWAWDVTREIPVCIATGEAAGLSASICCSNKYNLNSIKIKELQTLLVAKGCRLSR
jgi:hypothetical protein